MAYVPYWDEYDLATTTKEFRDRWDAVASQVPNFDGCLIEESLTRGWSVEETIAIAQEVGREREEDARLDRLHGDHSDFDMSMNY